MIQAYSMAYNEREWVEQWAANCLRLCDKVTLFDNGSDDGTQALARAAGCEVIDVDPPQGPGVTDYNNPDFKHGRRRNWCIERLTGDWIFNLDVDEVLHTPNDNVLRELVDVAGKGVVAVAFRRYTLWMDEGFYRKDWVDEVPWLWRGKIGIHYGEYNPPHENLETAEGVNIRALSAVMPDATAYVRHYHYVRGWKALKHLGCTEEQRIAEVKRLKEIGGDGNTRPVPWKD